MDKFVLIYFEHLATSLQQDSFAKAAGPSRAVPSIRLTNRSVRRRKKRKRKKITFLLLFHFGTFLLSSSTAIRNHNTPTKHSDAAQQSIRHRNARTYIYGLFFHSKGEDSLQVL